MTGRTAIGVGSKSSCFQLVEYDYLTRRKSNRRAAGVHGQILEMFKTDLAGNLYKIWKSHVVKDLLSTSGARRLHSKDDGRRKEFRCAHLSAIGSRRCAVCVPLIEREYVASPTRAAVYALDCRACAKAPVSRACAIHF